MWMCILLVCWGLVWSGPFKWRWGLIFSGCCASVYLCMFRICSLILYVHIFMGLVLWKVKKLFYHPNLTLDLLTVCLTFPLQTSPSQEMSRFCFHTLWSYRFSLTRVRFREALAILVQYCSIFQCSFCLKALSGLQSCSSAVEVFITLAARTKIYGPDIQCFILASWKFALDAIGKRKARSIGSYSGMYRGKKWLMSRCVVI